MNGICLYILALYTGVEPSEAFKTIEGQYVKSYGKLHFSLGFLALTTLFTSLMPLEGGPDNERGCHERQADGEVDVHSAGLVVLLAIIPVDYICAHECLRCALVGVFDTLNPTERPLRT